MHNTKFGVAFGNKQVLKFGVGVVENLKIKKKEFCIFKTSPMKRRKTKSIKKW
jgi:hypothetical protein